MILLSKLVERYQATGTAAMALKLLPSHRQLWQAMRRCRRQGSDT